MNDFRLLDRPTRESTFDDLAARVRAMAANIGVDGEDAARVMVKDEPMNVPETGIVAGDAIVQFHEQAAAAVERNGQKLLERAQIETDAIMARAIAHKAQCDEFANALRECGRLQAERIVACTTAVRDATMDWEKAHQIADGALQGTMKNFHAALEASAVGSMPTMAGAAG